MANVLPGRADVATLFCTYHRDPKVHGWRVRMRHRFGYFSTEQWYEAVVDRLVTDNCRWIDVGGGKSVLPQNPELSRELAGRCQLLVGVDPSSNIDANELVHERVKCSIEDFLSDKSFDLATLRMVAEHIERPEAVADSLARLIRPGGHVVIYTPNRWSPISIAASVVPNRWHHHFTRLLWSTEQEDVFPTCYKMNTRRRLGQLFRDRGFAEAAFAYLDNCHTLQRFRPTCFAELCLWRAFRLCHLKYPANDLLGVYRKL